MPVTREITAAATVAGLVFIAGCGHEGLRQDVGDQFGYIVDGDPSTEASAAGFPNVRLDFSEVGSDPYNRVNEAWGGEEALAKALDIEPQYPDTGDSLSPADLWTLAKAVCVVAASEGALDPTSVANLMSAEETIGDYFDPTSRKDTNAARAEKINCENAII